MDNMIKYTLNEVIYDNNTRIYRGIRNEDSKAVIIKTSSNKHQSYNESSKLNFEYNILKSFKDIEGVIRAYSFEKIDNLNCIVMEDWNSVLLSEYLKNDLSINDFLDISINITKALSEVHQKNIMHKDIKPSNILINPQTKEIKIIDFGKSSLLNKEDYFLEINNILEGSIQYISPEQTGRVNRSIDYRSDLYSLGVSFYEILTGKLPFYGESDLEFIHMHLTNELKWDDKFNYIPSSLREIINKLMEKEKDNRYQSAEGLLFDLKKFSKLYKENLFEQKFSLGEKDYLNKINISKQLYGKSKETDRIKNSLLSTVNGGSEVIFIGGNPGVGKSKIIEELYPLVTEKGAYFIQAKTDQYQRDIPYKTLIETFRNLFQQILMEDEDRVNRWKNRILDKIGQSGQLITNIIPEFAQIIGEQPPVQELNSKESQNRFIKVFYDLVSAMATEETPLVFFIDDMQWCDAATLSFIKIQLSTTETPYTCLICAYRDNDLNEINPLQLVINEIKANRNIEEIRVLSFKENHLEKMIADTLKMPIEDIKPLARIINSKTKGNPYFTIEFFKSLENKKLINFDFEKNRWSWDSNAINSLEISHNVVNYIIDKIIHLPSKTQLLIKMSSCLGTKFSLQELDYLTDLDKEFYDFLIPAVQNEIVKPIAGAFSGKKITNLNNENKITFSFSHDKVQQAAYSMLKEEEKKEIHLKIARMLMKEKCDENFLRIVYHYNEAVSLIENRDEKTIVAKLNLEAIEKSKKSVAFEEAYHYVRKAEELLKETIWNDENKDLLKQYLKEHATCAYLIGKFEEADLKINRLLSHLDSNIEKAEVYAIKTLQYSTAGKMKEAIRNGITGVELLGKKLNENPKLPSILFELIKIKSKIKNKKIRELVNLKEIEEKENKLLIQILLEIAPSAYLMGNENLFAMITLRLVNYTLQYGDFDETAFIYTMFGMLNVAAFNDYETGIEFGKLSMEVNKKYENLKTECRIYHAYSDFIMPWFSHWSELTPFQRRGIDVGYQSGDYLYLSYIAHHIHTWNPNLSLDELCKLKKEQINIIRKTKYQDALEEVQLFYGMCMNFRDLNDGFFSLNFDNFNEEESLDKMRKTEFVTGITVYNLWKAEIYFLYNRYEDAKKYILEAEKTIGSIMGLPYTVRFYFLKFMILSLSPKEKITQKVLRTVYNKKFKKWAELNPDSFNHLKLILEAELLKHDNNMDKYLETYDKAISEAKKNNWQRDEALANELVAKYLVKNNKNKLANGYLQEAISIFKAWGAERKVNELEKEFNHLFKTNKSIKEQKSQSSSHINNYGNSLDVLSIVKASQIISNEMELKALLEKIMHTAIENAGAQNGCYIAVNNNNFNILIELNQHGEYKHWKTLKLKECNFASQGVINYVARTSKDIVYYDANSAKENINDEYIQNNSIKSILCLSIKRKQKLKGILYLENRLSKGVFSESRIDFLKMLLGQMDISIDNANLYNELKEHNTKLENEVMERTRDLTDLNKQLEKNNQELSEAYNKLEEISKTDPLTKLLNRRSMLEILEDAVENNINNNAPFNVLIMDIDNFKIFNDKYGHDCGDFVLKSVSDKIAEVLREEDSLARWGGEEFLVLIPNSQADTAKLISERIRAAVSDTEYRYNDLSLKITLTIGLSEYQSGDKNIDVVIKRADEALYEGKRTGKNKVVQH